VRRRRRAEPERPLPGLAETVIRPGILPAETMAQLRPYDDSAHRPAPGANAWPDDAVLLTYGELRALVALHLDLARECMPNTQPWGWVKDRARAMRDGETPLLLAEVLTR
jgi:hypothetical protein